jgi:menaquinone-specific isochorismate synthase
MIEAFLESGAIVDTGQGSCVIGWGKRTWLEKPSDGLCFYFPDFFLQLHQPWFIHESMIEINKDELLSMLIINDYSLKNSLKWVNSAKPGFENIFGKLQKKFNMQTLKKAVPYIFENTTGHINVLKSLRSILNYSKKHPIFAYGFWSKDEGMIGATPELLFKISNNELLTMACAGTSPLDEAEKMLEDQKLLHEHNLVIEGIRSATSGMGNFIVGDTRVQKYTNLCHLITPITIELQQTVTADQVTKFLHPTPALGAYPREEGHAWLKELNLEIPRMRFGAPVGFSFKGRATCYVAIRNVQWNGNAIKLGAGCGVIPTSQFAVEWNEILLKIKSIKELLAV